MYINFSSLNLGTYAENCSVKNSVSEANSILSSSMMAGCLGVQKKQGKIKQLVVWIVFFSSGAPESFEIRVKFARGANCLRGCRKFCTVFFALFFFCTTTLSLKVLMCWDCSQAF